MIRSRDVVCVVFVFALLVFPLPPANNRFDWGCPFALTAYAEERDINHAQRKVLDSVTDMIVALSTRTGASDPSVVKMLQPAAAASAQAFRKSLEHHANLRLFADRIEGTLSVFDAEYKAADQDVEVISARADATNKLFRDILQNADQAGISREELELALLSAFSELQSKMSAQPLVSSTTAVDRELVNLLMLASVNQVHQRSILDNGVSAVTTLNVDPTLSAHYMKTISILDASLLNEMVFLEKAIADPAITQSSTALSTQQYNLLASYDMFEMRYYMELYNIPYEYNCGSGMTSTMDVITRVVSRMNGVGGIMSNVTVTSLMQSGVADGAPSCYYWSLREIIAYDWIRPDKHLHYKPVAGLADDVLHLGYSVPVAPDFTLYTNPYLAVFQMKYDFDLDTFITGLEWNQALTAINNTGSIITVTYTLQLSKQQRRAEILSHFGNATNREKQALAVILSIQR